METEWARSTGTRMQVADTAILSSSKIFQVSLITLLSSSVIAGRHVDRGVCG